jgi:hypothetical protein
MGDAQIEKAASDRPVHSEGIAIWGLLLLALAVGFGFAMNRLEGRVHAYFRKIPDGNLYWDKYVEGLALPGVGICIYAALLVGTGIIILSSYRAVRALVTRRREAAEYDSPHDND